MADVEGHQILVVQAIQPLQLGVLAEVEFRQHIVAAVQSFQRGAATHVEALQLVAEAEQLGQRRVLAEIEKLVEGSLSVQEIYEEAMS